jgi:methanogenic corrinoid protein MtbC1
MAGLDGERDWFKHDVYRRTAAEIMLLKSRLPGDSVAVLAREVLSRLAARLPEGAALPRRASASEIEQLCTCLISDDNRAGRAFVEAIRAEGATPEEVYLAYLAAAARRLGEWWEADQVSFVQVTIGTGRIYAIMRTLAPLFETPAAAQHRAAVFAAVPGDSHTLGVTMAADLFRRHGWNIALKVGLPHEDLVEEIEATGHHLIGLSAAGRHSASALVRLVVALRIACPQALIVICGHVVADAGDLIGLLGVDGAASDLPEAERLMAALWDRLRDSGAAQ